MTSGSTPSENPKHAPSRLCELAARELLIPTPDLVPPTTPLVPIPVTFGAVLYRSDQVETPHFCEWFNALFKKTQIALPDEPEGVNEFRRDRNMRQGLRSVQPSQRGQLDDRADTLTTTTAVNTRGYLVVLPAALQNAHSRRPVGNDCGLLKPGKI
jgi:hypothetical protein